MTLNVWTQLSGYSFGGPFSERLAFSNITLPVVNPLDTSVTYSVITGKLPPGLRIQQATASIPAQIVGTPFEVSRETESTFCIRASKNGQVSDRTFSITIVGNDIPQFVTPSGNLGVGINQQFFTLDSSYIDYQIDAFDSDIATGQQLTYFIADDDGRLPPGLVLTPTGRIVGFVQPTIVIRPQDGNGTYDDGFYDTVAFDFALRPTNGYDSYIYDTVFFDYNTPTTLPKKLNLNYEFKITVTDGETSIKRTFAIFVVGDDYFRADNTNWLDGNGLFTADATYLRGPVWLTASDLGTYRANNYVTLIIDTYDTDNVSYELQLATTAWQQNRNYAVNDLILVTVTGDGSPVYYSYICIAAHNSGTDFDNTKWADYGIPPGMQFDAQGGEVYGAIPYQPAISKIYRFTIRAQRYGSKGEFAYTDRTFSLNLIGEIDSVISWLTTPDLGTVSANFVSTKKIEAVSSVDSAILLYRVVSGSLPPGLSLDLDGEIVGKVKQYADNVTYLGMWRSSTFITAAGFPTRTYALNDVVLYNGVYYKCTTAHAATTTFNSTYWILYSFAGTYGLTNVDGDDFKLDGIATKFDNFFKFTVEAKDQYGYSARQQEFILYVDQPNQLIYSNIRTKPFLKVHQRDYWSSFINNSTIFTSGSIYRPNDPSFGVQQELSMLIYAGIETVEAAKYISAMGLNHTRKRFQFGDVKKAIAYNPGTHDAVYEVIYIQMVDPLEPNGKRLPSKISIKSLGSSNITVDNSTSIWAPGYGRPNATKDAELAIGAPDARRPDPIITVDSTGYKISNPKISEYFPSSITNWRENIKNWQATPQSDKLSRERNYLPLWMRSIQPGSKQELDFQLAVPLCYCKIGTADDIILNIKNYIKTTGFDFKLIDYTADRYIIDAVDGYSDDKYLVFRNDRITV